MAHFTEKTLEFLGFAPEQIPDLVANLNDDLDTFPIEEFRIIQPSYMQGNLGMIEYEFGTTGYDINKAKPGEEFPPSCHGGTGLNRENLLFFIRASQIAREKVPDFWSNPDPEFVSQVISSRQHVPTLNEIWWLSRFLGGATISREKPINPSCERKIDWSFSWDFILGGPPIVANVEVKQRIGADILRVANGEPPSAVDLFDAGLTDKNGRRKFRESSPNEINILAISLLGEIGRDVQSMASEWIQDQSDIDALLIFSRFSQNRSGFDVQAARKTDLIDQILFRELSELDLRLHSIIETPYRIPNINPVLAE